MSLQDGVLSIIEQIWCLIVLAKYKPHGEILYTLNLHTEGLSINVVLLRCSDCFTPKICTVQYICRDAMLDILSCFFVKFHNKL